jgi:hypothetical protein
VGRRRLAALGAALLALGAPRARADDVLEGFEDEAAPPAPEREDSAAPEEEATGAEPAPAERWWELDGSVALSSSLNYLSHRSAAPPPKGAKYGGVSRLRTRLNLELDLKLPRDFDLRVSPYIWYDFAYLIRGHGSYTEQVIDEYEWEGDFQDSYIQGPLLENVDLKVGRQVVNWGRSDTLRVLDVLNPLDNREPGRADIEDLRRSIGMAKLDTYLGAWTFSAIAIPELRFDDLPPVGSDFNFAPIDVPTDEPSDFTDSEWAVSAMGIFAGWDLSFHFADVYDDIPSLEVVPVSAARPLGLQLDYDRLKVAGMGGNYTRGAWLFKSELAWLDGFRFTTSDPDTFALANGDEKKSRFDAMLGIEYYGWNEMSVAFEVVNRHLFDYEAIVFGFPTFLREDSTEYALRWTADWLNARLQTTLLAVIFGYEAQDGAVLRLQADYTIRDGLVATAGLLLYEGGDLPPLSEWDRNDRLFFDLKYSF